MKDLDRLRNDITILLHLIFFVQRPLSSYQLAQEIFSVKNRRELLKKESYVRKVLKRWYDYGVLIKEKKSGNVYYKINQEKIFLSDNMLISKNKKICLGKVFCFYYNGWTIVQLE